MPRRVVVLGAGFAGLAACEALFVTKGPDAAAAAGLEVVLVDRHTYNTFQPLLYQVATAGLNPGDIAYPVRSYLQRHHAMSFRHGTVAGVDFERRTVEFEEEGAPSIGYDYLVVATGATTNFFGVDGAEDHSRAIYTMEDATRVRDDLSASLEDAATYGVRPGALTVVIIGGGATGVEMAGTLAELRGMDLHRSYPGIDPSEARIVLVEMQDRLLTSFGTRESEYALGALASRGVEVRLRTEVKAVGADHVVLGDGEVLACGMVIWSAGVSAGPLASRLGVPQGRGGRIVVGSDLRLEAHPEVFVAGDVAAPCLGGDDLVPQLAQPAIQEGRHVGRQILRLEAGLATEPFSYRDKGIMATIGRRAAVAEFPNGLKLRGTLAWLAWLGLHVMFLVGFRNRFAVLLNWAWRYLWWRRGPRVIPGV